MSSFSLLPLLKRDCLATDNYVCYHIPIPAVIGIVIGTAFIFLTLTFVTFICMKRRRYRRKQKNGQNQKDEALSYMGSAKAEQNAFNPNAH
jgi:uncharacterized membrane protein